MAYTHEDEVDDNMPRPAPRAKSKPLRSREEEIPPCTPRWQDQEPEDRRIAEELFQLRAAEQLEIDRLAREYRVATELTAFEDWIRLLRLQEDGMVLYWEKTFDREGDSGKTYRTACVYSDGLWWASGKSTAGRTTDKLIAFWIGQGLTKDDITATNMGQLLKDLRK